MTEKQAISTSEAPAAIGPYSQAIKAGQLLFVSGQIPLDPATGNLVNGTVEEQAHRCLKNLQAILTSAGLSMEHVVRTTIFLKDMGDFSRVNEVYGSYFPTPHPARACVEVSRLPRDVMVEIDAIAHV